jgi:hypothetical protein
MNKLQWTINIIIIMMMIIIITVIYTLWIYLLINIFLSNIFCFNDIISCNLFRYSNSVVFWGAFTIWCLSWCLDSPQCSATEPAFPPHSVGRHSFGTCSYNDVQSLPWTWIWNRHLDRQMCLLKCDFGHSHVLFWKIVRRMFLGIPYSVQ